MSACPSHCSRLSITLLPDARIEFALIVSSPSYFPVDDLLAISSAFTLQKSSPIFCRIAETELAPARGRNAAGESFPFFLTCAGAITARTIISASSMLIGRLAASISGSIIADREFDWCERCQGLDLRKYDCGDESANFGRQR